MWFSVLIVACLLSFAHSLIFHPLSIRKRSYRGLQSKRARSSALQSSTLDHASTALVSLGADYASEIENAVGEEIFGPIFQAGIFLFVSGIVAALGVAFIVSKSDAWDDLEEEFDAGKKMQLISSDAVDDNYVAAAPDAPVPAAAAPVPAAAPEVVQADSSGIDDLDL
jgi:hypothetical protein